MEKRLTLIENYFLNHNDPNEEEFLNFACQAMFLGYLVKSLKETKKKFLKKGTKLISCEIPLDFDQTMMEYGKRDEYKCFFESIISNLTKRQQQYLRLSFLEGYSDRMIASYMGITPQSVYDLKKASFARLRKELSS